ncbi:hypothetical protein KAFR_0I01250 [Kazachstania africana CBS 2517]|uniref:Phosphatidylethanolamine N-methyltransferase n=1 Tax=Kazachstania africana (strain ATCC 22294 / BCRC 22015 / CBS 2517 / CECT 1963 / NBRC 1671 / NRRL Y-8276) TaxID=1071382 RepID=H2AZV6_KAZAF|nr:hypothetical protein KAFR_0I01250 [Kazachstania africana CBS 2517]CCF59906.1 hypothetical protein KAFR_0I01250 [Kazachstania africana CBS 2517]
MTSTVIEKSATGKASMTAKTRSTGIEFVPPKTHDMVRSLFDPTLKKSFLELTVSVILISNFCLAHWLNKHYGLNFTKNFYLLQYLFWRLSYNVGIGYILHYQSHAEFLTKYCTQNNLFSKDNNSKLSRLLKFEINSKLDKDDSVYNYPDELNCWMIFRTFVDLILMQDFDAYMLYVFFSIPKTENLLDFFTNWKTISGTILILLNVWIKLDAHRVVKDFAWYWGDFFFLQLNSELIFDGVFNISPHPMYSIGYLGYYGLSLMANDYKVLLVSIFGHFAQFLFLKYVESPHIERIYGADSNANEDNSRIDDLITKENYDYSRPLINVGLSFNNFDKLRITDSFTLLTSIILSLWAILDKPNEKLLFVLTFSTKLLTWLVVSFILFKQSTEKWFTKIFIKNGYTQVYSYQQWQFIYNFSLVLNYTLLSIQTISKIISNYSANNNSKIIFGALLVLLQIWCNKEIRSAISDFGWFYGDFFLTNYIQTKKLTSEGIYRYLNNPETVLGIAGVWGTVLMTDFAWENLVLASLYTLTNFVLVKFVEMPHVNKLYGDSNRLSGVRKTLLSLKPLKRLSDIVHDIEHMILRSILDVQFSSPLNSDNVETSSKEWENVMERTFRNVNPKINSSDCKFELVNATERVILPSSIKINWRLPAKLFVNDDWIGLYNIFNPKNGPARVNVLASDDYEKSIDFVSGTTEFTYEQLPFENGVYEMRYHSNMKNEDLLISMPFEICLPRLNIENERIFQDSMILLMKDIGCLREGKYFQAQQYFNSQNLQEVIKFNVGVELSNEYIKNVNGDVDVISKRVWYIKKILNELT